MASHLRVDIITLFPSMFVGPLTESLIGKAQAKKSVIVNVHNLRDFSLDSHHKVDDKLFGGGTGMVIQVEPVYRAIQKISSDNASSKPWVIYLSPQGETLTQSLAKEISQRSHLVLICGHYEGIDERAFRWIDQEVSIGDYVLTGGELPAMVLVDVLARLVPGVVKEWSSIENDSFYKGLLDCSHYTRPASFMGMDVPSVLLSGNHKAIQKWREENAYQNTIKKRPDLISKYEHSLSETKKLDQKNKRRSRRP